MADLPRCHQYPNCAGHKVAGKWQHPCPDATVWCPREEDANLSRADYAAFMALPAHERWRRSVGLGAAEQHDERQLPLWQNQK